MVDVAFKLVKLFSCTPATPADGAKLVSIAFSHYCEKARWGLDISPLHDRYVEDAHMPVFHIPPVVRISKDKRRTGTPMLVLGDGTVMHDSTLILEHLCNAYPEQMGHLYPPGMEDQVKALVAELDAQLGVQSRRVAYYHMAKARREGVSTANPALFSAETHQIPKIEGFLWRIMEGSILPKMLGFMDITDATAAAALEDCRKVFARATALLAEPGLDGKAPRKYLLGTDKITAADITFAALAYPLLGPPQLASMGFGGDRLSPWVARLEGTLAADFRASPAGQFALRLYAEERYLNKPYGALKLRTPNRNKYPWQPAEAKL